MGEKKVKKPLVRRQIMIGFIALGITLVKSATFSTEAGPTEDYSNTTELCTPPAIGEFPGDIFTQEQRLHGGFILHFLIALYFIFSLALVCDDYFVPVLEDICESLNISSDVAGATFMAAGTSSPEFFTNVIGTFITESDLGIGTIIGTAVFNIFGVIAACGLFTGHSVPLEWYPITRDCFVYCLTIVVLIIVLIDSQVFWYESLGMVLASFLYTVLMYYNKELEVKATALHARLFGKDTSDSLPALVSYRHSHAQRFDEENPAVVLSKSVVTISGMQQDQVDTPAPSFDNNNNTNTANHNNESVIRPHPWKRPSNEGFLSQLHWMLYLPINIILWLTVPKMKKLYPLCFIMCMAWIGVITYVIAWMITLIGFTFGIPDSVMGLSFLAIGTSVPEVFSSLIVSRQGKGSMAVSNSIGSNTFDILVCLGLPWTIKSIMNGMEKEEWFVEVNSDGLAYTTISLLASLILLYLILVWGKFLMTKLIGLICLIVYGVFLSISIMFELNVFFPVNLPTCQEDVNIFL